VGNCAGTEFKEMKTKENLNTSYIRGFAILMAGGLVVGIGWMFLVAYFQAKEFPELSFADSLQNERVLSFEANRGIAYVDFGDGCKHTLNWGQNWNYDDYPTIVSIISIGDIVSKKANSDTIVIAHSGKDYFYILGQMIEKKR
jgi:hypothetical protein